MAVKLFMATKVRAAYDAAVGIKAFDLVPLKRAELPTFAPGAYVTVQLPDGMKRQYSIASDPGDLTYYRLAVLLEPHGLGGSVAMHRVAVGETLYVSYPDNRFPLATDARRHVFVAGGIGITPFIPMAMEAKRAGAEFELHYCARTREQAAFVDELQTLCGDALRLYLDGGDPRRGLDVGALLLEPQADTQVYCCGPAGLMEAVRAASTRWPPETVRFEAFAGLSKAERRVGEPFELMIQSTGQVLAVPADRSALEVLNANGFKVDSCCESGACGSCMIRFMAGEPIHRDFALRPKDRIDQFIACVSRAKGRLTLDL